MLDFNLFHYTNIFSVKKKHVKKKVQKYGYHEKKESSLTIEQQRNLHKDY
jgi:hypothetical protein